MAGYGEQCVPKQGNTGEGSSENQFYPCDYTAISRPRENDQTSDRREHGLVLFALSPSTDFPDVKNASCEIVGGNWSSSVKADTSKTNDHMDRADPTDPVTERLAFSSYSSKYDAEGNLTRKAVTEDDTNWWGRHPIFGKDGIQNGMGGQAANATNFLWFQKPRKRESMFSTDSDGHRQHVPATTTDSLEIVECPLDPTKKTVVFMGDGVDDAPGEIYCAPENNPKTRIIAFSRSGNKANEASFKDPVKKETQSDGVQVIVFPPGQNDTLEEAKIGNCTYEVKTGGGSSRGKTRSPDKQDIPSVFLQLGQIIREYDQTESEHGFAAGGITSTLLSKASHDNFSAGPAKDYYQNWKIDARKGTQTLINPNTNANKVYDTNFGASVEMFCDSENGLWAAIGAPSMMKHHYEGGRKDDYKINKTAVTGTYQGKYNKGDKKGEDTHQSSDGMVGYFAATNVSSQMEVLSPKKPSLVSIFNLCDAKFNNEVNPTSSSTDMAKWIHHSYTESQKYITRGPHDTDSTPTHSRFPEIKISDSTETQNYDYRVVFYGVLDTAKGSSSTSADGSGADIQKGRICRKLVVRFKVDEDHNGVMRKEIGASGAAWVDDKASKKDLQGLVPGTIASGGSGISISAEQRTQSKEKDKGEVNIFQMVEATITFDPRCKAVDIMKALRRAFDDYFCANKMFDKQFESIPVSTHASSLDATAGIGDYDDNTLDTESHTSLFGNPLMDITTGETVHHADKIFYGDIDANTKTSDDPKYRTIKEIAIKKSGAQHGWPVGGTYKIIESEKRNDHPTYVGTGEYDNVKGDENNDGFYLHATTDTANNKVTYTLYNGNTSATPLLESSNYQWSQYGSGSPGFALANDGLEIQFGAENPDLNHVRTPFEPDTEDDDTDIELLSGRNAPRAADVEVYERPKVYPTNHMQNTPGLKLKGTFKIIRAFCASISFGVNSGDQAWFNQLHAGNPWFTSTQPYKDVYTGEIYPANFPVQYTLSQMQQIYLYNKTHLKNFFLTVVNEDGQLMVIPAIDCFTAVQVQNTPMKYTKREDWAKTNKPFEERVQTSDKDLVGPDGKPVLPMPDLQKDKIVTKVEPLFRFLDNLNDEYSDNKTTAPLSQSGGGYGSRVPDHILSRCYDKIVGKKNNPIEFPVWKRLVNPDVNTYLGKEGAPQNPFKGVKEEAQSPNLNLATVCNYVKNELTIKVYDYNPIISIDGSSSEGLPASPEYTDSDGTPQVFVSHFKAEVHGGMLLKFIGLGLDPRGTSEFVHSNVGEVGPPTQGACQGEQFIPGVGNRQSFIGFDRAAWDVTNSEQRKDFLKLPLFLGLGTLNDESQSANYNTNDSSAHTNSSPVVSRETMVGKCGDGTFPSTGVISVDPETKIPNTTYMCNPKQSFDFRMPVRCPAMTVDEKNELVQFYANVTPYNRKRRSGSSGGKGATTGGSGRMLPTDLMNGGNWNNGDNRHVNNDGGQGCWGGPCGYVTLWKYDPSSNLWDFKEMLGGPKHVILEVHADDDKFQMMGKEMSPIHSLLETMSSADRKLYVEQTALDYHTVGRSIPDANAPGTRLSVYSNEPNTIINGKGQRSVGQAIRDGNGNEVNHYVSEWGCFGVKTRFALEDFTPTLYVWEPNAKYYDEKIINFNGGQLSFIIPMLRAERGLRIHIFKYDGDNNKSWVYSGFESYNDISGENQIAVDNESRSQNIASTRTDITPDGKTVIQNGMGNIS